jgi:hypothetical protein
MPPSDNLLAWIEPRGADTFVASFIGEGAVPDTRRCLRGRVPAQHICASANDARYWVKEQAVEFGLPVKWLSYRPDGLPG